mmetsp:Transcript_4984/g.10861  ORF Transcript_4984/g.10861 Transcript_4984/m.10861 type:complete len:258 (-) Transcript_4984:991-1764(-)
MSAWALRCAPIWWAWAWALLVAAAHSAERPEKARGVEPSSSRATDGASVARRWARRWLAFANSAISASCCAESVRASRSSDSAWSSWRWLCASRSFVRSSATSTDLRRSRSRRSTNESASSASSACACWWLCTWRCSAHIEAKPLPQSGHMQMCEAPWLEVTSRRLPSLPGVDLLRTPPRLAGSKFSLEGGAPALNTISLAGGGGAGGSKEETVKLRGLARDAGASEADRPLAEMPPCCHEARRLFSVSPCPSLHAY